MGETIINNKVSGGELIFNLNRKLVSPPAILGRDRLLNASVLIPLFWWDKEWHLLFQKRSPLIRQGGEICFPGGRFDPEADDNYIQTAVRETIEEMGIAREDITVLGHMGTLVNASGVAVDAVPAVVDLDHPGTLDINPDEVEKVIWIPLSFFGNQAPVEYSLRHSVEPSYVNEKNEEITLFPARELGLPERYWSRWSHRARGVLVYRYDDIVIWGLTAELVKSFVDLMKGA